MDADHFHKPFGFDGEIMKIVEFAISSHKVRQLIILAPCSLNSQYEISWIKHFLKLNRLNFFFFGCVCGGEHFNGKGC